MRRVLAQIWRLLRLCLKGRDGRIGLACFAVVLVLNLAGIWVTLRLIAWTADFYDALENVDAGEALRQIGVFGMLTGLGASRALAADYIRKLVQIRWRRALTAATLDRWLKDKAYWYLQPGFSDAQVDNPDQRIADDSRMFVDSLLTETLDLVPAIVGLFSYVALLWSLSTFPLAFSVIGLDVEIPRYMVWAAFLYVALSSGMTHLLGYPLRGLFFEQQRREADFRFALARLRESVGEIAISDGEPAERRLLDRRFAAIMVNWRRLIGRELILGCFTRPYMQTILRIPIFLALPAYLAGRVSLGGLMEIGSAFQNVATTLSWFIFSYKDLADLVATSGRLDAFVTATETAGRRAPTIVTEQSGGTAFRAAGLVLRSPDGRVLGVPGDFSLEPGRAVWIRGPSGAGKSTLLKALAGLWPHGSGRIERPAGATCAFLPQVPYLPLDGLSVSATYPADPAHLEAGRLDELISRFGLCHRASDAAAETEDGIRGLSGGERQRLALLRLLVLKPDWAFLDEATSALDAEAEADLMGLLRSALPETTFVVVAHREPRGLGDLRRIEIG